MGDREATLAAGGLIDSLFNFAQKADLPDGYDFMLAEALPHGRRFDASSPGNR